MATCEFIEKCPIYNKFKTEMLKNIYIRNYCTKDFSKCRRYQVRQSTGQKPPDDLLPDGQKL
ncbi:MAG: hypothetical protein AB1510_02545 [Bacillota bacterium]